MKHTSKNLKNSVVELEVTLDHKEFLDYYQPVHDAALAQVHLKGFRPGAAPKEMAEKAVDKEKVFEEAVRKAVQATLKEIAAENEWQVIDQPKIEVMESKEGMKYKATLSVFPKVQLGDYKKIAKKVLNGEMKEVKVEDKELEETIKWILNSRAKLTRVAKEAVKGNVMDIDFEGTSEGKPLDGASGKADSFVLGEGKFVPGFEENLVSRKEGDTVEFAVTFPKDYWKDDMRGKKVNFKVKVHGVFERELPELTDEFVKGLGKFESAEDLRKNIREGLTKEKTAKESERVRLKMLEQIIKNAKMDIPDVMLRRTLDSMVQEYKDYAAMSPRGENPSTGSTGSPQARSGQGKKGESDAEIRKQLEGKARDSVATNLILYQIAKEEHLEPTPQEVEEDANKFVKTMRPEQAKSVDPQKLYDYSYGVVQNKKVFEFLENLK